jgi:hypothetical protein
MSTTLNGRIATEIADTLKTNGYSTCTPEDVFEVQRYGSVAESTVGEEYDASLTDQIIDQLDARGIEVG